MDQQSIEKLLVLGTNRLGVKRDVIEFLQSYRETLPDSEEEQALSAFTYYYQLKKAQSNIGVFEGPILDPIQEPMLKEMSVHSIHHFNLILEGKFGEALVEFIDLAVSVNRSFPPESLPALLDKCLEEPGLYDKIKKVLGRRGQWLITLKPAWQTLALQITENSWLAGNQQERIAFLQKIRETKARKFWDYLNEVWPKEPYRNKIAFLEILEGQVTLEDEPFLLPYLEDRRKEVRKKVASLLSSIKESTLVHTLTQEGFSYLKWNAQNVFEVALPQSFPDHLLQFGLEKNRKKERKQWGAKGDWVFQILTHIPPSFWEGHFGKSPTQCVQAIHKSEWRKLLLRALIISLNKHPEVNWQEAVGRYLLQQENPIWLEDNCFQQFAKQLPDFVFNQIGVNYLTHRPYLVGKQTFLNWLIGLNLHKWTDDFTKKIIRGFQRWMGEERTLSWGAQHYKKILQVASYQANPFLKDQFRNGWNPNGFMWGIWEHEIHELINTWQFRKEMRAGLKGKEE